MNKRTTAVALSAITTLTSLVFIIIMAAHPQALVPHSLHTSDSSTFLGSFVLARTLPLTLGFAWLVYKRNYQLLSSFLWILAMVQLGDLIVSVAYGNIGGAVGPAISAIIYVFAARTLRR